MSRILFVDDEPQVLKGIERTLRRHGGEWDMAFATSADQALTVMEERPVDVMVTDIRMPGMQGDALIERVHDLYPRTVPVALSGQCSHERAIAISRKGVRFLAKPCDGTELVAAITEAFIFHERIVQSSPISTDRTANEADLRQAVLILAAAVVKGGLLNTAEIPEMLRSQFFESVDPAVVGLLETRSNKAVVAPTPDPELDELRARLGIIVDDVFD